MPVYRIKDTIKKRKRKNQPSENSLDAIVGKKLKQGKELINRNKTLTFLFIVIIVIPTIISAIVGLTVYKVNWIGLGEDTNQATTIEYELDARKENINLKDILDSNNTKKPLKGKVVKIIKRDTDNIQQFKTLWDWLQLGGVLAIPIMLYYFDRSEQRRAEKRNALEKEEAASNQREDAFENYIAQISQLIIDTKLIVEIQKFINKFIELENEKRIECGYDPIKLEEITKMPEIFSGIRYQLNKEPEISIIFDIIRARTFSILRKLREDGKRKGEVIRFLIDLEIINKLDLSNADLNDAELNFTNLDFVKLTDAQLNNAELNGAELNNAKLIGAELNNANLDYAQLNNANLRYARLNNAELHRARLNNAELYCAELNNAKLHGAELNNAELHHAELNDAKGLTPEQIKEARNWEEAKYDEELRIKLFDGNDEKS